MGKVHLNNDLSFSFQRIDRLSALSLADLEKKNLGEELRWDTLCMCAVGQNL